jgi:hypothetical protein
VEEKELKVTDKRIFTAEGELREEYRHLETVPAEASPVPPPASSSPATEPAAEAESPPAVVFEPQPATRPLEIPGASPGLASPTFFDLVAMLAEPASLYLGDVALPDGKTAEDLDMARVHIDLLAVLRAKTQGQLNAQETAFLDEILYRLRLRYVQKRG